MALPEYASQDVSISWGPVPITGTAADSFVSFARTSDQTDESVGADGQVGVTIIPDKTGLITIELMQTSESNLLLSGLAAEGDIRGRRLIRGDITIADPSGSVLALGRACHLKTLPEIVLSTGQETRSWTFFCEGLFFTSVPEGLATDAATLARIAGGITTFTDFLDS